MANFTQMSNAFAQQYLAQQNAEGSSYYTNIKAALTADTGSDFIPDRMTAFVGTNPNIPNSSYVVVVEPSFVAFSQGSPDHQIASMISYYADGKAAYCGTEVLVNHNPYQVQNMTLIECDTNGQKVTTTLDRGMFSSGSVQDIALQMSQMSTAQMDPDLYEVIGSIPTSTDLAAMVNIALEGATNDSYSAPLYPAGGVESILNDSAIPAMFSQAAAMKTAAGTSNLTIVACCSTSCSGCSSSSTSVVVKLPSISW